MDWTEKLRAWGSTYAAARSAERAAAHANPADVRLEQEARALRERADSLHREICREIAPARGR